jgi:hypothetical protein
MAVQRRTAAAKRPVDPQTAVAAQVTSLAQALMARSAELGQQMADEVLATIPAYGSGDRVSAETLRRSCAQQVEAILRGLGDDPARHAGGARTVGRARAAAGVPLTAVMDGFRIGGRTVWNALSAAALDQHVSPPALVRAATDMWVVLDTFTQAMSEGYRDEMTDQMLGAEERRSALVQALLAGRLDGETSAWDVAQALRLPPAGPYVVVAATVTEAGQAALPQVERRLRDAGIASAWRLEHDAQLGVCGLPKAQRGRKDPVDKLLAVLTAGSQPLGVSRLTVAPPVGVSPAFDRLAETPEALRLARIALRGSTPERPVVLFGSDPLAIAAVAEPDVMRRIAGRSLAGLDALSPRDRRLLLETFGTWLDNGSADVTAEALFVHPNTVRHRLRRIETLTDRSLGDPRTVAELALAYEIDRRLSSA